MNMERLEPKTPKQTIAAKRADLYDLLDSFGKRLTPVEHDAVKKWLAEYLDLHNGLLREIAQGAVDAAKVEVRRVKEEIYVELKRNSKRAPRKWKPRPNALKASEPIGI